MMKLFKLWYMTKNYKDRSRYGLSWRLSGKESACNAGDIGMIPGSGRFPGREHDNPLQYSCLENPMDRKPDA